MTRIVAVGICCCSFTFARPQGSSQNIHISVTIAGAFLTAGAMDGQTHRILGLWVSAELNLNMEGTAELTADVGMPGTERKGSWGELLLGNATPSQNVTCYAISPGSHFVTCTHRTLSEFKILVHWSKRLVISALINYTEASPINFNRTYFQNMLLELKCMFPNPFPAHDFSIFRLRSQSVICRAEKNSQVIMYRNVYMHAFINYICRFLQNPYNIWLYNLFPLYGVPPSWTPVLLRVSCALPPLPP